MQMFLNMKSLLLVLLLIGQVFAFDPFIECPDVECSSSSYCCKTVQDDETTYQCSEIVDVLADECIQMDPLDEGEEEDSDDDGNGESEEPNFEDEFETESWPMNIG
ncbi:uncharacterized protein LOC120332673 [Styela clava]